MRKKQARQMSERPKAVPHTYSINANLQESNYNLKRPFETIDRDKLINN